MFIVLIHKTQNVKVTGQLEKTEKRSFEKAMEKGAAAGQGSR